MMLRRLPAVMLVAVLSGCVSVAPPYQTSLNATNLLKDGGDRKVKMGEFHLGGENPEKLNKLTIRGGAFNSPTNNSYSEYLKDALKQQLYDANRLDQNSKITVSGVLLKNSINTAGFVIGYADLSARFVVRNTSRKKYDRVFTVHHEWPSSFAGAIAIPAARQNYPVTVQKLLDKLFNDRKFISAIR